jgi:double-stranded uracil-DNA glycosylase
VLFCGINPGRVSAAAGAHFANPRNDFWRLLHAAGFTRRLLTPPEQFELLQDGIGVTNAASRTTPGSGDLRKADFAGAAERLERLAATLKPAWIGFVGKEAYRGAFGERPHLGVQERRLRDTRLFVLPSTSPANAAVPWADRLRWFRTLADLSAPQPRPAVRAVVLAPDDRVLLQRYWCGDEHPGVWVCPGGAVDPGEDEPAALRRELRAEFGLEAVEIGPWIWTRRHVWAWRGIVYDTRERFAHVRLRDPAAARATQHDSLFAGEGAEQQTRWWTLAELDATGEEIAPRRLASLLAELFAHGPPREPIEIGV